jgi:hypothetical protein
VNAYDQFEAESLPLFDDPGPAKHFGGSTYIPEFDQERLNHQSRLVYSLMIDGEWRTLEEISAGTGAPQASVSARLRDFFTNTGWSNNGKEIPHRRGAPTHGPCGTDAVPSLRRVAR